MLKCYMALSRLGHQRYIQINRLQTGIVWGSEDRPGTHTTASSNSDLDRVSSWLAHGFDVQRFVRRLLLPPVNAERCGVDGHLDTRRPVGVHLSVFVVETL